MRKIKSFCKVSKNYDEKSQRDESMNLIKFMNRIKKNEKITDHFLFPFRHSNIIEKKKRSGINRKKSKYFFCMRSTQFIDAIKIT